MGLSAIAHNVRPLHAVAGESGPSSLGEDKTFFVKTKRQLAENAAIALKRRLAVQFTALICPQFSPLFILQTCISLIPNCFANILIRVFFPDH